MTYKDFIGSLVVLALLASVIVLGLDAWDKESDIREQRAKEYGRSK